ncbi:MAG: DUF4157 domain-containing protein, partial [Rhodospirillales bacterium]|nr:DUF4157 domain-containing protein [Rhodospirillales bacterium]
MSRAAPIASLLPPMQRKAAPVPRREAAAQGHLAAGSAPFPLAALRVNPVAQRNAALDAETEHDPAATPVQPRLEVGPTNDVYEQEADRIADTVQRMGQVSTRTMAGAGAAPLSVQPKCAACEAEDKVQRKGVAEAEAETGPPTLAAAPATLNAGGNQLAAPVRGFYEQRLGRDLSAVRVHQGAPAQALNESISARAFTYGSHIWLGAGEGAAPSRTLSHEMAHVLQQTQPRALGEEGGAAAAAAPALVQRLGGARWVPARSKLFTRSAGVSHDAVVKEISRANKDTLAEVPIPNAGRRPGGASGIRPTPGFADFFRASTNGDAIPGVKLVPGDSGTAPAVPTSLPGGGEEAPAETDTGKEAAPPAGEAGGAEESGSAAGAKIVNFNKTGLGGWGFTFGQKVLKGGSAHSVAGNQHPRVSGSRTTGGRLVGVDKAPIGIKLGELKPGHNVAQRLLGASNQLPRYQTGLSGIAAAVNAANARDGSWNMGQPGLMQADGDLKVPSKLSMTSTSTDFHRQLQLSARVGLKKLKSTTTVPGRLVFGRDPRPGHAGVWTYLWVPQNPTLAAGMGPTQDKQLRALVAELDKLVKELTAKPTKLAQPRRAGPARRARRQVRRTPHKDAFNAKAWEHERKTEFAPKVDALAAADLASPDGVQRGAAMQEAFAEIASELAGFTAPKLGSAATTELKSLHRLKRMAGPLGLLLGKLRTVFGGVFVKLADAWDGFKEKFAKRINRPRLAGATGQVGGWRL